MPSFILVFACMIAGTYYVYLNEMLMAIYCLLLALVYQGLKQ